MTHAIEGITETISAPTVSVLMPVYNAERYVAEAVESILAQTFADFELIIIDDGSTDRSLSILRRSAENDLRIRLVSRPNTGYVVALNEMLEMARGEFVARMDADDVSLPERFAIQVAYLREHPEIICIGTRVQIIDEAGRDLLACHPAMDHDEVQALALAGRCPLCHPSVMMRREPVISLGGYQVDMEPAEDHDLWLRLGEQGRMVNLPDVLVKYRNHDSSVSEVRQSRQLELAKLASDRACERRGIARCYVPQKPWRPTDRRSRCDCTLNYGWMGFMRGDRRMALVYGVKAVRLMPWRNDGWRLLACAALKPSPKRVRE
jgi:glycosyltransferase involved in cell wall biosynthesis